MTRALLGAGLALAVAAAVVVSVAPRDGAAPAADAGGPAVVGEGVRTPFGVVAVERTGRGAAPRRIEVTLSVINLSRQAVTGPGPVVLRDGAGAAYTPVGAGTGALAAAPGASARAALGFDVPPGAGPLTLEMRPAGMPAPIVVELGTVGGRPRAAETSGVHGH